MNRVLLGLLALAGCVKSVNSGREQYITFDEATEIQLGIQADQEALARAIVAIKPEDVDPVVRVGKRLATAAKKLGYRWRIHALVDDAAGEAWCLPGGKLAMTTGFFRTLRDDAETAFVLGHVIAHALQRHGAERLSGALEREEIGPLALAPLGATDPEKRRLVLGCYGVGMGIGAPGTFDPRQESEADRLGLELMARAGYDPKQAVPAWKRIESGGAPGFLLIHPSHPTRAKDLESRLPSAEVLFDQAVKATVGKMAERPVSAPGASAGRPAAASGSIVASFAGSLRTSSRENRPALLVEFWMNEDVFLEQARLDGPEGLSIALAARVGIPTPAKKQAVFVRPDTGSAGFPGGRYTLVLTGAASGRTFEVSRAFDVR